MHQAKWSEGEIREVGHLLHAEITGMRQDTGIKMGQQGGPEGLGVRRMDKVPGKLRPGVHFNEQLTEIHAWQPLGDARRLSASALAGRGSASKGERTISSFSTRT